MTIPCNIYCLLVDRAKRGMVIRGSAHAAAIVYKKRLLSIGNNKLKTHPIMREYGRNPQAIFLHAEIDAIVKCIRKHGVEILSDSVLYVLRVTKGGVVSNSQPCPGCQKAIDAFGIKGVYYT